MPWLCKRPEYFLFIQQNAIFLRSFTWFLFFWALKSVSFCLKNQWKSSKIMDFANMFWSISMKKLTETERCLKQPLWSVILLPRVLGLYWSVFYVSSTSDKSYKLVYSNIFEYFLPARIWCEHPYFYQYYQRKDLQIF